MEEIRTVSNLIEEYWTVQRLKNSFISLKDKYLKNIQEGKLCIISLDCYDLLDWLFPPGFSFHDEHYEGVHNLWKTVEENINPNDSIKLCIPPGSALEIFHTIKHRADIARNPFPQLSKNSNNLNEAWQILQNYLSVQRAINGVMNEDCSKNLYSLVENKTLISYNDFIDSNQINRLNFDRIIGSHVNAMAGKDYLISKRESAKPEMALDYSTYSIQIDMLNLQHNVYVNEILEKDKFCLLTSHGGYTLKGWEKAYIGHDKIKSFEHSTIALILSKTMKDVGGVKPLIELLDEATYACKRYIDELKKYKPFYDWFESKTKPVDFNTELSVDKKTEAIKNYWEEHFQHYFIPKQFVKLENEIKKDSNTAINWHNDKKQREKDALTIQQKATEIYQKANFINPGMRNILLPSHKITDEILEWLND